MTADEERKYFEKGSAVIDRRYNDTFTRQLIARSFLLR
jgi:hypothetical protein